MDSPQPRRDTRFNTMIPYEQQQQQMGLGLQSNGLEDQGTIFINRDGELFRYVLQYMRDGQNTVLPEDISLLRQLVREADFFGIERYKEMLQMEINDLTRQRDDRENGLIALRNNTAQIAHILYQQPFKK
ncbi:hypothetical protein WR25_09730 [Diploscapter pachys]|uniref:Potassium channel tetramerisation-type BTB domain-containing protein n=1 Tax=Diploscapter pachys TaxID=2018661 RepID=A0A2A2K355_9BILA|nr:hypothetical protein WR25_09730 [Diploscapter pachys]